MLHSNPIQGPDINSVQQNTEIETSARLDSRTAHDSLSFSSYYSKQHEPSTGVSDNVLPPLLEEYVKLLAMVPYCMKILKLLLID